MKNPELVTELLEQTITQRQALVPADFIKKEPEPKEEVIGFIAFSCQSLDITPSHYDYTASLRDEAMALKLLGRTVLGVTPAEARVRYYSHNFSDGILNNSHGDKLKEDLTVDPRSVVSAWLAIESIQTDDRSGIHDSNLSTLQRLLVDGNDLEDDPFALISRETLASILSKEQLDNFYAECHVTQLRDDVNLEAYTSGDTLDFYNLLDILAISED